MTLKSIPVLLSELEKAGKIVRFVPRTRRGAQRRLYLTREAEKQWIDPNSATNLLCGKGFIDAALTRWASNGRVYTDEDGKPRFLKELIPPPASDLWEIRVVDPNPQARLIGGFLEQDTLILMRFHTRRHLGDKGSEQWNEAMTACDQQWNALSLPPRLRAGHLRDYISENFDDFPLNH